MAPASPYPARALSEGLHRSSSRRLKPALAVVPIVVIAIGFGAYFVLSGGKVPHIPGTNIGQGPDDTVHPVAFRLVKTIPIPTVADAKLKKLKPAAKSASDAAVKSLDDLYTEAFLDPGNWRDGSYDNVWSMFSGGASASARKDANVVTLGSSAGDAFETVLPSASKVTVKVLMDQKGQPATAVALVSFKAKAHGTDGHTTLIQSTGQLFLQKSGSGWRVVSYHLTRQDRILPPKPGPSGSATPAPTPSAAAS